MPGTAVVDTIILAQGDRAARAGFRVERFWIPPGNTAARSSLEEVAYASAACLFWRLARPLAIELEPLPTLSIGWQGRKGARRRTAKMSGAAPASPNADSAKGRSTECVSTHRC
jgi:hypothetical protein